MATLEVTAEWADKHVLTNEQLRDLFNFNIDTGDAWHSGIRCVAFPRKKDRICIFKPNTLQWCPFSPGELGHGSVYDLPCTRARAVLKELRAYGAKGYRGMWFPFDPHHDHVYELASKMVTRNEVRQARQMPVAVNVEEGTTAADNGAQEALAEGNRTAEGITTARAGAASEDVNMEGDIDMPDRNDGINQVHTEGTGIVDDMKDTGLETHMPSEGSEMVQDIIEHDNQNDNEASIDMLQQASEALTALQDKYDQALVEIASLRQTVADREKDWKELYAESEILRRELDTAEEEVEEWERKSALQIEEMVMERAGANAKITHLTKELEEVRRIAEEERMELESSYARFGTASKNFDAIGRVSNARGESFSPIENGASDVGSRGKL